MTAETPLSIGIAGLGTVGATVAQLLAARAEQYRATAGRPLNLVAVSARARDKDRGFDMTGMTWCDDPVDLAQIDAVDIVVELIGGSDGPALDLTRDALSRGKAVVTANKAMIAKHGRSLAALAEEKGVALRYEAAVAGGIPIIKSLREGLAANTVTHVAGILNGTCNYILTRMENEGLGFADVLKAAQDLGYAEADPSFDINGMDTAHKTAILSTLAFGAIPDLDEMTVEGIESIATVDIDYARDLGYRIKLLGRAANVSDGGVDVRVGPAMVPLENPMAKISGPTNAVQVLADPIGETVHVGPGAGGGPTASAVLADVIDVAGGSAGPVFAAASSSLTAASPIDPSQLTGRFYLRMRVTDLPGVMATIALALGDEGVSIDSLLQRGSAPEGGVYIVLTTHQTGLDMIERVLNRLTAEPSVLETPTLIRIEAVT